MIVSLSVAAAANEVIGRDGALPWHLPEDLRRFRRLTAGHAAVLGRVTHESIIARLGRPLPGRTSVVVSSRPAPAPRDGVIWARSVPAAMAAARAAEAARDPGTGGTAAGGEVFVLGGAAVYAQALPLADRVYLTRLDREVDGDTSMPPGWLTGFRLASRDDRPEGYSFLVYERAGP